MFVRPGRGDGGARFVAARIAMFCAASGVWIAGVLTERREVTGAAIAILIVAVLLGLPGRRRERNR